MRLDHPVLIAAGPAAQPVFIWDTREHDRRNYSLKRRVFIYEAAIDLNIPIYAGDAYEMLLALSSEDKIYAAASADPHIRDVLSDLGDNRMVEMITAPKLAQVPANTDTGRFFRFWNRARKSALTHSKDALMQDSLVP
jgi:hypothetical protein